MKRSFMLAAIAVMGSTALMVHADIAGANKYLTEAAELIDKGSMFYDDAGAKLDLAEVELEDVPAADKAPLAKKVAELRAKMTSGADEQAKAILTRKLDRGIKDAEGAVGNLATWNGAAGTVRELLDDKETTRLLGEAKVAEYRKQFSTFEKLHGRKALKENLEYAEREVARLEAEWEENKATLADVDASPNAKSSALQDTQRAIDGIDRYFKDLPEEDASAKALKDRVAKISTALESAAGDATSAEVVERIQRGIELYANEFEGMDKETDPITWDVYAKESSERTRTLGVKATTAYVERMESMLQNLEDDESYALAKNAPKVKALVDDIKTKVTAGRKRIAANAVAIVESLEKAGVNQDNASAASSLRDSVRNALGNESDEAKTLMARIDAKIKAFEDATTGAEQAKVAAYQKLKADAAAAWPNIVKGFETEEGFDPANPAAFKGKLIKIETDNLVGWRFKTGDFPFATTLNGLPVAARYDADVRKAIDAVEAVIGRGLGDSDDDGKWTIIARVEGNTGRLTQLIRHEGDINVNGSRAGTVTGTEERPVDAPIITIVAAHCGPLAVGGGTATGPRSDVGSTITPAVAAAGGGEGGSSAVGGGIVSSPATPSAAAPVAATPVATPTAVASVGRGLGARLFSILTGLFAVLLGGTALMKVRFAPLAANAGATQVVDKIGSQNLVYLGIAGIAWGAVAAFSSLLALPVALFAALIGFVGGAAMVIAGFVNSSDLFEQKGLVKPDLAAKIKGFAIPAGLTCAALGLLGIVFSVI